MHDVARPGKHPRRDPVPAIETEIIQNGRKSFISLNVVMKAGAWYECANVAEVDSPALLIFPDRAEENVRRMIALAGGPERLCPHVKTHKLAELVRMQMALGIKKFKCATIAEAEMVAGCDAPEVLLAYQLVGPKVQRFIQ